MRDDDSAKHHPAAEMIPPIVCELPTDVASVEPLAGHRLRVRFHDGVRGVVDLSRRVASPRAGVFAALADLAVFARVTVEHGAVTWPRVLDAWPGSIDLAPDAMHDELAAHGVWVLD